jgi:hypothetical protein
MEVTAICHLKVLIDVCNREYYIWRALLIHFAKPVFIEKMQTTIAEMV